MALAPGPSKIHGAAFTVQPEYFVSSLFVTPLRNDISRLLSTFTSEYQSSSPSHPFPLFKAIWKRCGWDFMHLKACEDTGRAMFLSTVSRSFLERAGPEETILTRVGAIFGLYIFHFTQPSSLYHQDHIPIPIDSHRELFAFPSTIEAPLSTYTAHILNQFSTKQTFYILPPSSFYPSSPRTLPESTVQVISETRIKRGRISRVEKSKRAKKALIALAGAIGEPEPEAPESSEYSKLKARLLSSGVSGEALAEAQRVTHGNVKKAERYADELGGREERDGLQMIEDAMRNGLDGLLRMVGSEDGDDDNDGADDTDRMMVDL